MVPRRVISFKGRLAAGALSTGAFVLGLVAALPTSAQVAPPRLPGPGLPGGAFEMLPEITPGAPPDPGIVLPRLGPLPAIPPPPDPSRPAVGPRVLVREVRLVGNTVLGEKDLKEIVQPYLDKELSVDDLQNLRQALTLAYVNRGYINSGAVLPDQEVVNGVVTYQIVEGVVTEIEVTGNKSLNEGYIRNRLSRGIGPPLNIGALERRLQLALQDPLIEQMNVEVRPGVKPGEATLGARVVEANPYQLTASIANSEPPSVGGIKGEIAGVVRNLTGWGDALSLRYGRTRSLDSGGFAYMIPITADDTMLSFRYDINDSRVIEQPFKQLNITSRSQTYEVGLSHPLYRTPQQSLTFGFTFAHRTSETFLLDEPFSFTPGVVDGKAKVTVLRFSQDFLDRRPDQVIALRSTFSFGLNALDATVTPVEPNGTFKSWLGQAQYVRRVFGETQIVARADAQLTDDPLFSIEQFPLGGFNTVRGYRENQLVRDNAVVGSIEARIPVWKLGLPFITDQPDGGVLSVAPFFDYGYGWNRNRATPSPRSLYSVGLGLRLDLGTRLQAQLYYGYAFRDIDNTDHDIQDSGIHFRLVSRLY